MRFALVSAEGADVSMAARLVAEGHEAKCYTAVNPHVGEGLIELEHNYEKLIDWAAESMDSMVVFTTSEMGEKADAVRDRGIIMLGGGTFCDRLEEDRLFGQSIAQEAGAPAPPHEDFSSLSEVAKIAKTLDRPVYFKTDRLISCDATRSCDNGEELARYMQELRDSGVPNLTAGMLQDKIPGVPYSVARWWNGRTWVGPWESTIELKAFGNDDFGPSTGCSANVVWFSEENEIAGKLGWENFTQRFRQEEAPPGLYDINSIVDETGTPYFLEWTPRFGYDSEPTSTRLIDDLGAWFWYVGTGQGGAAFSSQLAYSVRLSVPPYPCEYNEPTDKKTAIGVRVSEVDGLWDGNFIAYEVRDVGRGLEVASHEGMVGLSLAIGDNLSDLHEEVMAFAEEIDCSGIYCRTDGAKKIAEIAEKLQDAGVAVHEGLLK